MEKQSKKGIRIPYHSWFFLFGFIYYLLLPSLAAKYCFFEGPGDYLFYESYNPNIFSRYTIILIVVFVSFYLGDFLGKKIFQEREEISTIKGTNTSRYLLSFILLGIIVSTIIRYPSFKSPNVHFDPYIGFIATLVLFSFFILLYDIIRGVKAKKLVLYSSTIFLLIFFLLRSGTRMYFLIPIIMSLIIVVEFKLIKLKYLLFIFILFLFMILYVGLWRKGIDDMSLLPYIFLAEPCFTWIGISSFLDYNHKVDLISFPSNYLSSVITFVPQFILPSKNSLVAGIPYDFEAPLGATNVLISLLGGFGSIGSAIYLFLKGLFCSFLYKKSGSSFIFTYYVAYCSLIPFQFFRDSFAIVNKSVFFTFLLLPLFFITIQKIRIKIRS